jgi:hypothetical protein
MSINLNLNQNKEWNERKAQELLKLDVNDPSDVILTQVLTFIQGGIMKQSLPLGFQAKFQEYFTAEPFSRYVLARGDRLEKRGQIQEITPDEDVKKLLKVTDKRFSYRVPVNCTCTKWTDDPKLSTWSLATMESFGYTPKSPIGINSSLKDLSFVGKLLKAYEDKKDNIPMEHRGNVALVIGYLGDAYTAYKDGVPLDFKDFPKDRVNNNIAKEGYQAMMNGIKSLNIYLGFNSEIRKDWVEAIFCPIEVDGLFDVIPGQGLTSEGETEIPSDIFDIPVWNYPAGSVFPVRKVLSEKEKEMVNSKSNILDSDDDKKKGKMGKGIATSRIYLMRYDPDLDIDWSVYYTLPFYVHRKDVLISSEKDIKDLIKKMRIQVTGVRAELPLDILISFLMYQKMIGKTSAMAKAAIQSEERNKLRSLTENMTVQKKKLGAEYPLSSYRTNHSVSQLWTILMNNHLVNNRSNNNNNILDQADSAHKLFIDVRNNNQLLLDASKVMEEYEEDNITLTHSMRTNFCLTRYEFYHSNWKQWPLPAIKVYNSHLTNKQRRSLQGNTDSGNPAWVNAISEHRVRLIDFLEQLRARADQLSNQIRRNYDDYDTLLRRQSVAGDEEKLNLKDVLEEYTERLRKDIKEALGLLLKFVFKVPLSVDDINEEEEFRKTFKEGDVRSADSIRVRLGGKMVEKLTTMITQLKPYTDIQYITYWESTFFNKFINTDESGSRVRSTLIPRGQPNRRVRMREQIITQQQKY